MTDSIPAAVTETPALQVFEIPAEHMPGLLHKLATLSKKSERILGKSINLDVLHELHKPRSRINDFGRRVDVLDSDGNPCLDVYYAVTIDAETPKINGWTFVATIDHSTSAGNIIRNNPNAACEIPEMYRTVKPVCDHCDKIRSRRDTFLLRCDATGEFKQIGRQCIRDFIGYDVTSVVAMAEIVSSATPSASDGDSDWSGGMRDRRYIMVKTYLTHVAAVVRTVGWISRKDAEFGRGIATAGHAHTNMFPPPKVGRNSYERIAITAKDVETAEAALAYGLSLANSDREFDYKLGVLSQETMIEHRNTGLLAALVPAYFRHIEREYAQAQRRTAMNLVASKHVGAVGDKIGTTKKHQLQPIEATLYGCFTTEGRFGPVVIYRFQTVEGNVLVWFATATEDGLGPQDAANRVKVQINGGSVKKHDVYQDVAQTVLTRCKVSLIEPAVAA